MQSSSYRSLFDLDENYIYFNSAGSSPLPIKAKEAAINSYDFISYTKHKESELFKWLDNIRSLSGNLINAKSSEIALITNTSMGLNIIARGAELKSSDSVLVHRTEFPSNMVPWLKLRDKGVDVRIVDSKGFPTPEDFFKRVDKSTKIIAVSFVRFYDGFKFDLESLGTFCRENNILLVVDGIQGVGVVPIDVKKLNVDILSCAGAKWLCSPCGCGFLYISENVQEKIDSPFAGWLSWLTEKRFENSIQPLKEPVDMTRFEWATLPYSSFAAFEKTLELFIDIGIENINKHITELIDHLIQFISENDKYEIISSLKPEERSGFISFKALEKSRDLLKKLEDEKVVISYREGGIRVSPHLYNTMDEMKRFCEILNDFS